MSNADIFYNGIRDAAVEYLRSHKREERKSAEVKALEFMGYMFGANRYLDAARGVADVGVLVFGALDVLYRSNNDAAANLALDERTVRAALQIFEGKPVSSESILEGLQACYENFSDITGGSPEEFVLAVSSIYQSAKNAHKLEVPAKNPADFLIRVVERQRLEEKVLKIEDVFLDTSRKEWEERVLGGDVSEYTIPVILKMGECGIPPILHTLGKEAIGKKAYENAALISALTELPIVDTLNKGKMVFPNTRDYLDLSDIEIRETITFGLNEYLKLLEAHHNYRVDEFGQSLYEKDVKRLGRRGCLFGHEMGEDRHIILNSEIKGWNGGGRFDGNSWCSPREFIQKNRILDIDEYIDFNRLNDKWLSLAINEFIVKHTDYLIAALDAKEYEHVEGYCKDERIKLEWFSDMSGRFLSKRSKKGLWDLKEALANFTS